MTHVWPAGEPISVVSDAAQTPQGFIWRGRSHPVQEVAKRWRLDEGWWQERVWREYFKVATETGLLVVIYRDWLTKGWYLQGLYD